MHDLTDDEEAPVSDPLTRMHDNMTRIEKQGRQLVIGTIAVTLLTLIAVPALVEFDFNQASQDAAVRTMSGLGYSDIRVFDKQRMLGLGAWQGCDSSDAAKFIVAGISPTGLTTPAYVCVRGDRATVHF